MTHCVETIERIIGEGSFEARDLFQLGYNLGRLSELSGLGRGPFWDRWKDAVSRVDVPNLQVLARELRIWHDAMTGPSGPPPETDGEAH